MSQLQALQSLNLLLEEEKMNILKEKGEHFYR